MYRVVVLFGVLALTPFQEVYAKDTAKFINVGAKSFSIKTENFTDPYAINLSKLKISNFKSDTKIINGFEATKYAFPYQAAIYIFGVSGEATFCGGSLISENYILTAAHCIFETYVYHTCLNKIIVLVNDVTTYLTSLTSMIVPTRIMIILGNENLLSSNEYEVRIDVDTYVIHNGYNDYTLRDDICLLHLGRPVEYNYAISPIALPSYSDLYRNYLHAFGVVSGFGKTSDWGEVSTRLMYLSVRVIDNNMCNRYFTDRDTHTHNICSSGIERAGACQGDSGGPLVIENKLIGVVSFGAKYCTSGYPTVFTRVPYYLQWISYYTGIRINP